MNIGKSSIKTYFTSFNVYLRAILRLAYKKFCFQMVGSVFSGILGFLAEIGLSAMLVNILVIIGLVTPDKIPDFIRSLNLSNTDVLIVTGFFIFIRAVIQSWRVLIFGSIFFDFKRTNEQKLVFAAITDNTYEPYSGAYVSSIIANIIPRGANVMRNVSEVIFQTLMILPMLVFLVYLNLRLTALSIIGIGVIGIASVRINRYILNLGKKLNPIFGRFTETYLRSIRNRILLRIYGTTENEALEAIALSQQYRQKSVMSIKWQASLSILTNLIAPIWLLLILWASVIYLAIPAGILLSFFYIFIRMSASLTSLGSAFSSMIADLPALQELAVAPWISQKISYSDSLCVTDKIKLKEDSGADFLTTRPVKIEAESLSASYNKKKVFQDLNFLLPAGQCLGIVGPSGSGKSTLIATITGLIQPDEGKISIDSIPTSHKHFSRFRRNIGYVGSEPLLKQGTIYENLLYGLHESVEEQRVLRLLEEVRLKEISILGKKGLEGKIFEGGEGLSSGQKQRLCLARALLRNPRLLILDEATANIDEKNEKFIIDYLRKLKGSVTIIIASHRPQPLTLADQILDFGLKGTN